METPVKLYILAGKFVIAHGGFLKEILVLWRKPTAAEKNGKQAVSPRIKTDVSLRASLQTGFFGAAECGVAQTEGEHFASIQQALGLHVLGAASRGFGNRG